MSDTSSESVEMMPWLSVLVCTFGDSQGWIFGVKVALHRWEVNPTLS